MMPLSHTKDIQTYTNDKLTKSQEKINHLMYMSDLQVLGNSGSGHHQTNGDERKKYKRVSQGE